jgi:hypothetical protein
MFNLFKKKEEQTIEQIIEKLTEKTPDDLKLIRHQLGSLDLKDIEPLSGEQREDFSGKVAIIYDDLTKQLEKLALDEVIWQANNSQNWEQVIFARGTINGINLIQEMLTMYKGEYEENKKEEENKTNNA